MPSTRSSARLPFSWTGGDPSVDFVNTVSWGSKELSEERLRDYGDLLDWSVEARLLADAGTLRRRAARRPVEAKELLADALELRRALHELFAARARSAAAPNGPLAILGRWMAEVGAHRTLAAAGRELRWEWTDGGELKAPLRRVADAACRLLTGEEASRLKLCGNPDCGWAFVDRSRRGNRRWCEMAECGSRDKARRYYRRHRAALPKAVRKGR